MLWSGSAYPLLPSNYPHVRTQLELAGVEVCRSNQERIHREPSFLGDKLLKLNLESSRKLNL